MPCEDAPCCGCCTILTEQDHIEAAESYREMQDAVGIDEPFDDEPSESDDGVRTDAEADGDALVTAGRGTDEDGLCEGHDNAEW